VADAVIRYPAELRILVPTKRSQFFIGAYDKTPIFVAMRVSNPDRSRLGINRRDAAPTPTGFLEVVGNGFPVLHAVRIAVISLMTHP